MHVTDINNSKREDRVIGRIARGFVVLGLALALANSIARPAFPQTSASAATKTSSASKKPAQSKAPAGPAVSTEDIATLRSEGSKSAPITMEVFSDFECPACKQLFVGTLPGIEQNYVSTGKVYLIHRDYPLQMHKFSREAMRYADSAARIGRYNEVAAVLFARQEEWASTGRGSGDIDGIVASVLTPAEMATVRRLAKTAQIEAGIQKDYDLGDKVHQVNQTPTTIITYKGQMWPVTGVMSYPILKQFLDSLLAR
jgi:protein-disulfide isomerase